MTLIEVLIAMIILSISASALLLAMSRCLEVVRTARSRETARNLIARVDVENPIESVDLNELSESGSFEEIDGYVWYRDIEIVDQEERPGLFLITTRVQWAERGRDAYEEVTMFRYAPDAEVVTSQL
jgi:prepilin-type N-terminal cleavage/methylation domain-containing protein